MIINYGRRFAYYIFSSGGFVTYGFHKIKMTIAYNLCWKFIVKNHSNLQSSISPTITINHPSWQIYRYWTSYNIFHYLYCLQYIRITQSRNFIVPFFIQQYDKIVSHYFLLLLCTQLLCRIFESLIPGLKLNAIACSCLQTKGSFILFVSFYVELKSFEHDGMDSVGIYTLTGSWLLKEIVLRIFHKEHSGDHFEPYL